jgi:hypothetical protein
MFKDLEKMVELGRDLPLKGNSIDGQKRVGGEAGGLGGERIPAFR